MFDRKNARKNAFINLKKHYLMLVLACMFAAYLGVANAGSLSYLTGKKPDLIADAAAIVTDKDFSIETLAVEVQHFFAKETSSEFMPDKIGVIELGTRNGVFSSIVNRIADGRGITIAYETVTSVVQSKKLGLGICVAVIGLLVLLADIFIKNAYKVAYRRIYLESYKYEKIRFTTFIVTLRSKSYRKAAVNLFRLSVAQLLWDLTIIGGIMRSFPYRMVPYILAENPDMKYHDAVDLALRMMQGHKMECFKLDLSFIPIQLPAMVTFGLTDILFTNPYIEAMYLEYYVYLRKLAKDNKISYADELNDIYLYEKADIAEIEEAYADVIEALVDDIDVRDLKNDGIRGFVEDNLGIIYKYDKKEDIYNIAIEQEGKIEEYKAILDLKQYPDRLSPIMMKEKGDRVERVHYLRHYSFWSIVAMFFIFCGVGWLWEVSLELVKTATFVNRGVLHGPWLPIYGTGVVLILTLLYRFRRKPFAEAIATVLACGVLEYTTAFVLETTKGVKWWDYTGYFLNIDGRVCAEGLLVFMLGGLAVVYALGPMLDDKIRKFDRKKLAAICSILLMIFACDAIYSIKHPNTGKGITDYDTPIVENTINNGN